MRWLRRKSAPAPTSRPRARLQFQPLEDRCVPASGVADEPPLPDIPAGKAIVREESLVNPKASTPTAASGRSLLSAFKDQFWGKLTAELLDKLARLDAAADAVTALSRLTPARVRSVRPRRGVR